MSSKSCNDKENNAAEITRQSRCISSDEEGVAALSSGDSEPIARNCQRNISKPLSSDEEDISDEMFDIENNNNTSSVKTDQPFVLPFKFPTFDDSDSDVTYCSSITSASPEKRKLTETVNNRRNQITHTDSSDDEDFVRTPCKVKKANSSPRKKIVRKQLYSSPIKQKTSSTSCRTRDTPKQKEPEPALISGLPSTSGQKSKTSVNIHQTSSRSSSEEISNENESDTDSTTEREFISTKTKPVSQNKKQNNKVSLCNVSSSSASKKVKILKNIRITTGSLIRRSSITNAVKKSVPVPCVNTILDETLNPLTLKLFRKMVNFICSHENLKTILTEQETQLLNDFQMHNENYKFLCLKLFLIEWKWYNIIELVNKLQMKLSGRQIEEMYNCLKTNGLVDTDYSSEPCDYLLTYLHHKHLKEICDKFKLKTETDKKSDLIQALVAHYKYPSEQCISQSTELILRDKLEHMLGLCVKLSSNIYNVLNKVHVLYSFTNDFQSIQELYSFLAKIEKKDIFMPKFTINTNFQLFTSANFIKFLEAYRFKQTMLEVINKKKMVRIFELCTKAHMELQQILKGEQEQMPAHLMHFTAGHKYTEALSEGIQHIMKDYAVNVEKWLICLLNQKKFCKDNHGLWYNLLVRVQHFYLKKTEVAIETLLKALRSEDLLEADIYELSELAESIKVNKNQKISKLQNDRISCKQSKLTDHFSSITISVQNNNRSTETKAKGKLTKSKEQPFLIQDSALKHYSQFFLNRYHSESSLIVTIFFVLFWDIIYDSNIPGAFISEVQYIPSDLYTTEFYVIRRQWIDKRLNEITCEWPLGQLEQHVNKIWEEHAHETSYIDDDTIDDSEQLYNIILIIGRVKLSKILDRVAKNFKSAQDGIPHLFFWSVTQKKCKFVQATTHKGGLSIKQRLWLNFLKSVGADVEVCICQETDNQMVTPKIKKANTAKKEGKRCLNKSMTGKKFIL